MEANILYLAYDIQYSISYIYLYGISVLKMTTMIIWKTMKMLCSF